MTKIAPPTHLRNLEKGLYSVSFLQLLVQGFLLNFFYILGQIIKKILYTLGFLTPLQFLYVLSSFLLVLMSLLPWFSYHIDFYTSAQFLSSTTRGIFFLFSLNNILALFYNFRFKQVYAVFIMLLNLGLYIYGFFAPNLIHLRLQNTPYEHTLAIWLYGVFLIISIVTSIHSLDEPLIKEGAIKKYLLSTPKI